MRSLDAFGFDRVARSREPGGVEQPDGHARDDERALDDIASRPRRRRDDGPIVSEKRVEQTRLAGIRPTDEGDRNAVVDVAAASGRSRETLHFLDERLGASPNRSHLHADFFVGEVETDLEARDNIDEALTQPADLGAEVASERTRRQHGRALGACADQQRHRFSAGEIHPPVDERPAGELARCGQARALTAQSLDDRAKNRHAAVAREFHDILTGIGARRAHDEAQRVVHRRALGPRKERDTTHRMRRLAFE